jgi:hypothetical protein
MEEVEIALRCYVDSNNTRGRKPEEEVDLDRILVFDTETTVDQYQNLLFGSFQILEQGVLQIQGMFYGGLSKKELEVLGQYARNHDILLMPVKEFVDRVFLPEIYHNRTVCIGFNLPFDLSRLAISFGEGRGKNRGAFSLRLSEKPEYPNIVIKSIDSKRSFIKFNNAMPRNKGNNRGKKGRSRTYRGRFLDLRTLAFAMTGESHSLSSACKYFKVDDGKNETEEHGKVTVPYVEYNLNDVQATTNLFSRMMEEYQKLGLDVSSWSVYSPASIGKAYLDKMGIESFLEKNPDFPKELIGEIMSAYYGGRSEVRVRKTPVKICLIDFLSMYPTMCILQDIWRYVIADRIEYYDDSALIREFVNSIQLDDLRNQDYWKALNAVCLIQPNSDILPVRSKYGNRYTYNIGLNHLTSDIPIWYTLADVVASRMLTGKTPKIIKAIRFVPKGTQQDLKPIRMIGGREICPAKEDFFRALMEYRHEIKQKRDSVQKRETYGDFERLDALQSAIKIVSNATSYGIFVEINANRERRKRAVDVYGVCGESFEVETDIVEGFGRFFNPIAATMITSGARLVLAIVETLLAKHNAAYAYCDTDSMAIPPEYTNEIQDYFQTLSPYSFDDKLFRLEKENYSDDGNTVEPLWFYGISAKRYVLYNTRDGKPQIRKASSHGLGHLLNPFPNISDRTWAEKIWMDILNIHYGIIDEDRIYEEYSGRYAISRISVSSPNLVNRFRITNKGKSFSKQIKPFNFVLVGMSSQIDEETGMPVKPVASFTKNSQRIVHENFIDYNSGNVLNGFEYWKPMDDVFFNYVNHEESKSDGDIGTLSRKHLKVESIIHIGKESNNLEDSRIFGVQDWDYQIYADEMGISNRKSEFEKFLLNLSPKNASEFSISSQTLRNIKRKIKTGKLRRISKKNLGKFERAFRASTRK